MSSDRRVERNRMYSRLFYFEFLKYTRQEPVYTSKEE